jgi:hypothetical protein
MAFATAWTWLVSFFIQLVGVALGTNMIPNMGSASGHGASGQGPSPTSPNAFRPVATINTILQATAYVVYALLIITFTVFRKIASAVLLYALLCCVYATLLSMGLYFCPRLLTLLVPTLGEKWNSPLALRLVACSFVCLLVFAGHTFSFARKVVQSTIPSSDKGNGPYWWFQYGALELLPGILFLALLHPKQVEIPSPSNSGGEQNPTKYISEPNNPTSSGRKTPPRHAYHRRTDSSDSKSGARMTPSPQPSRSPVPVQQLIASNPAAKETTPLLAMHQQMLKQTSGDRSTSTT